MALEKVQIQKSPFSLFKKEHSNRQNEIRSSEWQKNKLPA